MLSNLEISISAITLIKIFLSYVTFPDKYLLHPFFSVTILQSLSFSVIVHLSSPTTTMISGQELYNTLSALVPLYVPMILAYASVLWWKIITPEQCSGINRFVAFFSAPLLNFYFLATNNPYTINLRFIAADTLQKLVILGALSLWSVFTKCGSIEGTITLFSLSTLPNTVVVGVPLLTAMYGDSTASLMSHIFVMQGVVWFTLVLFLYEYRAARSLVWKQFPENGGSISSFSVDSDVLSLGENEALQTEAEMGENGEVHVVVKSPSFNKSPNSSTEIFSMQRSLSFNTTRDLREQGSELGMSKIHDEKMWKDTICNQGLFSSQYFMVSY